jgi:hypothetical protein
MVYMKPFAYAGKANTRASPFAQLHMYLHRLQLTPHPACTIAVASSCTHRSALTRESIDCRRHAKTGPRRAGWRFGICRMRKEGPASSVVVIL